MDRSEEKKYAYPSEYSPVHKGLTKRELFAAMALQGMLANPEYLNTGYTTTVIEALRYANILIEQLDKE